MLSRGCAQINNLHEIQWYPEFVAFTYKNVGLQSSMQENTSDHSDCSMIHINYIEVATFYDRQ